MLALFGLFLLLTLANAYVPGACKGDCQALDPSLIRRASDGKYFRFSTGKGITIKTAQNLTGPWKYEGEVLHHGSSIHIPSVDSTNLWAPDAHYLDGTYYLYYSVSTEEQSTSAIGVATSTTMEDGSWQDHGETGVGSNSNSNYNAIDPNYIVIDGKPYLNFGSCWDGLQQVEMKDSLRAIDGHHPQQIAYNKTGSHRQEGAYVFHHDKYFYLFFSAGLSEYPHNSKLPEGEEYRIVVCRSDNGTSGYADSAGIPCTESGGSTLLRSDGHVYGPGGQGVLDDPDMGNILYYHYANENVGLARSHFQFGWNHLCWTNEQWPILCEPGESPVATASLGEQTTATQAPSQPTSTNFHHHRRSHHHHKNRNGMA